MNVVKSYFCSTIGQKQLMGLSGLVWSGFVLSHMLGNLLIFKSAEAYNKYSYALVTNPLLIFAEAILVLMLLLHIVKGVTVTIRNRSSRGQKPVVGLSGDKGTSFAVKTMIYQGVIIAVFIAIHLLTFKYGTYYEATYDGIVMRDLHRLILEVFQSPIYTGAYILCMIVLGLHLSHGFYSSIQTLGFHHPQYNPKIKILGHIYAVLVSVGFASQPVYVFLFT